MRTFRRTWRAIGKIRGCGHALCTGSIARLDSDARYGSHVDQSHNQRSCSCHSTALKIVSQTAKMKTESGASFDHPGNVLSPQYNRLPGITVTLSG